MAGVSTKQIKNRIRSMESTKQITKAMEMVAASKLRRAQVQIQAARPYFQTLRQTIDDIVSSNREITSPYLVKREGKRIAYLVIAGDRGLAGGYNSNVLKMVAAAGETAQITVLPMGRKTADYFQSRNIPVLTAEYEEAAEVSVSDCFAAAKLLCKGFREGDFDEVRVAYTEFVSVLSQCPKSLSVLPMVPVRDRKSQPGQITLYEPGSEEVFETIVPEYLGGVIYGALCESRASEQAARRTAMDSATKNAEDMIADLSLKFNRARQAAITQEITEIVAGAKRS